MKDGAPDRIDWQFDLPAADIEGISEARQQLMTELDAQPAELPIELGTMLLPPITKEKMWRAMGALTLLQEGFIEQSDARLSTLRLSEAGKRFATGIRALNNS